METNPDFGLRNYPNFVSSKLAGLQFTFYKFVFILNFYLIVFNSPGDALSKSEMQKAELEVEINKLKTEEAALKDALLKMQAFNEGLGQDKIELNKIILHVSLLNRNWMEEIRRAGWGLERKKGREHSLKAKRKEGK